MDVDLILGLAIDRTLVEVGMDLAVPAETELGKGRVLLLIRHGLRHQGLDFFLVLNRVQARSNLGIFSNFAFQNRHLTA